MLFNSTIIQFLKPVNKASSHWSEFTVLITPKTMEYIHNCSSNPTSLINPNCNIACALAGILLGDGTITKHAKNRNSNLRVNLAVNLRSLSFAATIACFLEHINLGDGMIHCYKTNKDKENYSLTVYSKRSPMFNELRDLWYPVVKTVPKNINLFFNDFGFALWIIGDGSRANISDSPGLLLHTQGFKFIEQKRLVNALHEVFGLNFRVVPVNDKGRNYFVIRSTKRDSDHIKRLAKSFMHASWHYKLSASETPL